jgi:hypothetical protein
MAVMYGITRARPPKLFVAVLLLMLLFGGPALVISEVYRLSKGRGSVGAALLYAILTIAYLFLAALITLA